MGRPPSLLCLPPTFYFPNVHSGGGARSGFCEPTPHTPPRHADGAPHHLRRRGVEPPSVSTGSCRAGVGPTGGWPTSAAQPGSVPEAAAPAWSCAGRSVGCYFPRRRPPLGHRPWACGGGFTGAPDCLRAPNAPPAPTSPCTLTHARACTRLPAHAARRPPATVVRACAGVHTERRPAGEEGEAAVDAAADAASGWIRRSTHG